MFNRRLVIGSVVMVVTMATGIASADPLGPVLGSVLGGVTGVLSGITGGSNSGASGLRAASGILNPSAGSALPLPRPPLLDLSSPVDLPGLSLPSGVAGVSVDQNGLDGSGHGDVLQIGGQTVLGPEVGGLVPDPLVGSEQNGEAVDIAILDGNSTSHAGPGGLLSAALLSGNDTATGGMIGAAVLSGTHSGQGNLVSVGAVNSEDLLHVCITDQCVAGEQALQAATGAGSDGAAIPQTTVVPGVVVGGGLHAPVTSSNPVANVGVLTGDHAGTGGLVGVGVLAGNNSGRGDLAGVCVLCGNNSGTGSLGVAVLSGGKSGIGSAGTLPVGAGAAVLSGGNSGNGSTTGTAVLSGDNSGTGGTIGTSVIGGNNSGTGGTIGTSVIGGNNSGNGGLIGAGALIGQNSGNGGLIGIGAIAGATPATARNGSNPIPIGNVIPGRGNSGGGVGVPVPQGEAGPDIVAASDLSVDDVTNTDAAADDDASDTRRGACMIVVQNVKGRTTDSAKKTCRKRRGA